MKRTALIVLLIAIFINAVGCGMLIPDSNSGNIPIPYLENYTKMKPNDSLCYEQYKYETNKSTPIYLGGVAYHGGFTLGYESGPYVPGFATFDLGDHKNTKASFVLGSLGWSSASDAKALVSVYADGKQVVDAVVGPRLVPERYTIDITGVKELSFKLLEGYCRIGVAEFTLWEGEAAITGPVPDTEKRSVELVRELIPYAYSAGSKVTKSEAIPKDDPYIINLNTHDKQVQMGGQRYDYGFSMITAIPLSGKDIEYMHFNTGGIYGFVTFTLGCWDMENGAPGKSWVKVYTDVDTLLWEGEVSSNALPQTMTLPLDNCKSLWFQAEFLEGGEQWVSVTNAHLGITRADAEFAATGGESLKELPDVCKLVSNIEPYTLVSAVKDPLFTGASSHKTFSLSGRKYNEGVVLMTDANMLFDDVPSNVCFNLGGQFKYLTLEVGLLDNAESGKYVVGDTLKVFLDGELSQTINLYGMDLPQKHTVELKNCKELRLELGGNHMGAYCPPYGLANMVVYKNEVVDNDLFKRELTEFPDKMSLLKNITPYRSSAGRDCRVVYDGSTAKDYFELNGKKYNEGLILKTAVYLDLEGLFDGAATEMTALFFGGIFTLLDSEEVWESSFAAFDVEGQFSKVTFTVASKPYKNYEGTDTLKIGSNEKLFKEITVSGDMEPTTYTVDIDNAEQLVFWLQCDGTESEYYAIYDIVIEK